MNRPILAIYAALFLTLAPPAFAGEFACEGVTSTNGQCGDIIKSVVTDRFSTKYPVSKYKLIVVSGITEYPDGTFAGHAGVWLSKKGQQSPSLESYAMRSFSTSERGGNSVQMEKEAIRDATADVMRLLGTDRPEQAQRRVPALTEVSCRIVEVTEQQTSVRNVCDSGAYGPTNCRDEATSSPHAVSKRVCD